jgi:hypothetical protein
VKKEPEMPDDTEKKGHVNKAATQTDNNGLSRRNILLGTSTLVATATMTANALAQGQKTAPTAPPSPSVAPSGRKAEHPRDLG